MEDITMAMTNRNNAKLDCMIYYTLDELVPQDHLVRKMEEALDFRFIYPKVQHLYSRHGRPSIDPVVLFKMLIINIVFGINSMRKTCQEIEVNLAYRWFLVLMRRFQTFLHGLRTIFVDIKTQLYLKRSLWKS